MVGPEAPQVVLSHRAGGHHMVHRPLEATGEDEEGGEQSACSRLGNGSASQSSPSPASLIRTSLWRQVLALTRCQGWQEAQDTEGLAAVPCLPSPSPSMPAGTGPLPAAGRNPWPQEPGWIRQDGRASPHLSVEMDRRHRRNCGPKAESPSGEPQLVQTPGDWPGLGDSDPEHTRLSLPSPQPADLLEWWESGVLHD